MHLLLTNDDGIGFKGIMALLRAAARRGHRVTMCAPRDPQSAMSQRITIVEPIFVSEYPVEEPDAKAYAIAGSPTDCLRIGLYILRTDQPDAVISGINNGYNAGMAVHYSGTVGAAREGAIRGYPSVATSIHDQADTEMIDHLADVSVIAAERLAAAKAALPPCTVLNINMPNVRPSELKPAVYAPLSTRAYRDGYEQRVSPRAGMYFWMTKENNIDPPEEGSDQYMLDRGHIVYTLMGNPACCAPALFDGLNIL